MTKNKLVITILIMAICGVVLLSVVVLKPGAGQNGALVKKILGLFIKEPLYIAVKIPLAKDFPGYGEKMLAGMYLYLEKAKREKLLGNNEIQLLLYEDDPHRSPTVSSAISSDKRILLLIEHDIKSISDAGHIYKKAGLPVITASPNIPRNMSDEWVFSVVSNTDWQGRFIANYSGKTLRRTNAFLIHEENLFDKSLSESFQHESQKLGIIIKGELSFDPEQALPIGIIKNISRIISHETPPSGIVFIAAGSVIGAKIVAILKEQAPYLSLIGPVSFMDEAFIREIENHDPAIEKQGSNGFLDGVYVISPYLKDIADETAYQFEKEYLERYNADPSWISACYYDVMQVAAESLRNAGIQGEGQTRGDRKRIKEALLNFYNQEHAIKGVTGNIYFNIDGNAEKPLYVGRFEHHTVVPHVSQYQQTKQTGNSVKIFQKAIEGLIISVNDKVMNETKIVRVGMKMNSLENLNIETATYTADFYLWFRFKGQFNDDIEFTNSINLFQLGHVFQEYDHQGETIRVYRLKNDFRIGVNYQLFPKAEHHLSIKFHHKQETRDKLIYLADTSDLPLTASADMEAANSEPKEESLKNWKITDQTVYADVITNVSTLGDKKYYNTDNIIAYSQFNSDIRIQKDQLYLLIKTFVPVIFIVVLLLLICLMKSLPPKIRLTGFYLMILITTLYHLSIFFEVSVMYVLMIEYLIFCLYALFIPLVWFLNRQYLQPQKKINRLC